MHRWIHTLIVTLTLALVTALYGCGSSDASSNANDKPKVVATIAMVSDVARNIAGDRAQVTNLLGEGVDPHLYKPTRSDVAQVLSADTVLYCGLMLEGRMTDTFADAGNTGTKVYAVTRDIDRAHLLEPPDFEGHWDPHVWMDVSMWSQTATTIAAALAEIDPTNKDAYQSDLAAYQAQLTELDTYVKQVIGSIPAQQRVLVTAHDAFNYFGRAYDIQVLGVQGISTESRAALDDINRLVDFLVENKVAAVFVESSVSDKNVKALIEGCASRGHTVTIGGTLFSDAMDPAGTYEGTYIGMIDHNATTIARALGGEAPEKGFQGKLTGFAH